MTQLNRAYDLACAAVRQRWSEQHPERLDTLNALAKNDIAVYAGSFDSVQEVLQRMDLPFVLDPKKLKATIAFSNCTSGVNDAQNKVMESFVGEGGWLVSSDWQLTNLIQLTFPNTVQRAGNRSSGNEVVGVEAMNGSIWAEVVFPGIDPQWWLEASSYPIAIADPDRVRIEAVSHELHAKYTAAPVAVSFDWEAGHVFHVISHFWLKQTRIVDDRYRRPCTEFLRHGMRLSEEGIVDVLKATKITPEEIDLASIQSAVTSVELVAGLCVRAKHAALIAA